MTMGQTTLRPYGRLIARIAIHIAACRVMQETYGGTRSLSCPAPTSHDTLNSNRIATIIQNVMSTDQKYLKSLQKLYIVNYLGACLCREFAAPPAHMDGTRLPSSYIYVNISDFLSRPPQKLKQTCST